MNETAIVKIEEHRNEKVVCFSVDCIDPENEAWGGRWQNGVKRMYLTTLPEGMWEWHHMVITHRERNIKMHLNM